MLFQIGHGLLYLTYLQTGLQFFLVLSFGAIPLIGLFGSLSDFAPGVVEV
jgi:hypothetical protein